MFNYIYVGAGHVSTTAHEGGQGRTFRSQSVLPPCVVEYYLNDVKMSYVCLCCRVLL